MKKIVSVILGLLLVLSLAACQSSPVKVANNGDAITSVVVSIIG